MNRLQLVTLLSWAGNDGLNGRKRLQKVVYFLQQAGCPLDCRFTLHHFGPYSRDVVDRCDDLVAADLIIETGGPQQYSYSLKPSTSELLKKSCDGKMSPFQPLALRLIREDIWLLELGSTILYFYQHTNDWEIALSKACEYKQVPVDNPRSRDAHTLAQEIFAVGGGFVGQSLSRSAL